MRRPASFLALLLVLGACSAGVSPSTVSTISSAPSSVPSVPLPMTDALKAAITASLPAKPLAIPDELPTPVALKLETTPGTPTASLASRTPKLADVKNLDAITTAYGITLSADQKSTLERQGFVELQLSETKIQPNVRQTDREFAGLYREIRGAEEPKSRTQANSIFYSSDVFLSGYNRIFEELIKEVENTAFFPSMQSTSKNLFTAANTRLTSATDAGEKARWTKIRDYFAVPHCILQSGVGAPSDPEALDVYIAADATRDSEANIATCIKSLKLGASEAVVLEQMKQIYAASEQAAPLLYQDEFADYEKRTGTAFKVDFSQFTPRSHYTGTSLRRQYFRAMSWYIHVPFFIQQPELAGYAFGIADLLAQDPKALEQYQRLERTIVFLVGTSDDLRPADFLRAIEAGRGKPDAATASMAFLDVYANPQVKSLGASYGSIGTADTNAVRDLTKGMRFFSGKVLRDTTWTSRLTQGDEKPHPGFTQKLPPMASSLQVMALLGSKYAESKIASLPFVTDSNRAAVSQMMTFLATETNALPETAWQGSTYHLGLWSLRGMFQWEDANRVALPAFMRSQGWEAKTLQAASGSWTELRHATLLYAKQSFAEMGAGWDTPCDLGTFPPPPMGYIEPQPVLYDRLAALSRVTAEGLAQEGFTELRNLTPLKAYDTLLADTRGFTARELQDVMLVEKLTSKQIDDPDKPGTKCTQTTVVSSDWEKLRMLVDQVADAQPVVVDGDYLKPKDRRAAIVADVHTGGDSVTPPKPKTTNVLYEALGVPNVILTLVQDANGPRATIGFTYRHHESVELLDGKRKTDEDWQKQFYIEEVYDAFHYTDGTTWPAQPAWYAPLFGTK